ncbi:hypothetical protein [Lysinibacillus sp. Bpr_S20]|uniref:hypothetical protein n=1 Tax=Lysinibacillus sp. Bpr_S20 TaxID=2933964 RepID=UPI002012E90A|nr:hypothetical protein [Lysinibacillus sp. Bpr_S20]MCL1700754.1 hypothetical protein [Lysinibacillus sp. Bpr_S20]
MFKANIKFCDGSTLSEVFLYKEQTLWTSIITDKREAEKLLGMWSTIYFGNDCIQGCFIPSHIQSYDLIELSKEEMNEIRNIKLMKELNKN